MWGWRRADSHVGEVLRLQSIKGSSPRRMMGRWGEEGSRISKESKSGPRRKRNRSDQLYNVQALLGQGN